MAPHSKYSEIMQELLQRIIAGDFPSGKLPSMQDLSKEYGVNLLTAKRAVKELEKRNIVQCHRGNRGTSINYERAHSSGMIQSNRFAIDEALSDMSCVQLNYIHTTNLETTLAKVSELFSSRYSWIKVNCIRDLKPQEAVRADEHSYDVIETGVNNFPSLIRSGSFLDLTETAGIAGTLTASRYIANSLDFCARDGRFFGLPFMWHTALIFKEGKQPLDTWEALESYLAKNHCKSSKIICEVGLLSLLIAFLGSFDKLKSKTLTDNLKRFIHFIRVLIKNSELRHEFLQNELQPDEIKAMIGYYCSCRSFANHRHLHATALPLHDGAKAMLHCTALGILAKTRHPQESWLWIKFLQRPEIQDILHQEPYFFSAQRDRFKRKESNPELRAIMERCLENGEIMPVSNRGRFVFYNVALPLINQHLDGRLSEDSLISELLDILEDTIQVETIAR